MQQPLADLLWLLEERELIWADSSLLPYRHQDWRSRYDELVARPDPLVQWMAQAKSHFLGVYAERLFSFALRHFYQLEILAEHHQLHQDGVTLGEVDALVRLPDGQIMQIEFATKFYLHRPDLAPHDWIGPNKNDSLFKKVSHARQHQLQILNTLPGRTWLSDLSQTVNYSANLMVFGRRFWHLDSAKCNEMYHLLGQDSANNGYWARVSELVDLPFELHGDIAIKPNWLAFETANELKTKINSTYLEQLSNHYILDSRPTLHRVCRENDENMTERQTGSWLFIVPDSW